MFFYPEFSPGVSDDERIGLIAVAHGQHRVTAVSFSAGLVLIGKGNDAGLRREIERGEETQTEGKGKALSQTRFHLGEIDIQLKSFADLRLLSFGKRLLIGRFIQLIDVVRPKRFRTNTEFFQRFDRSAHRTTAIRQCPVGIGLSSRIVIDEQSTDIQIFLVNSLRQVFIGT